VTQRLWALTLTLTPTPTPSLTLTLILTLTLTRCDTCRSVFGLQTWQSCALDFEYTLLHMSYLYR